MNDGIDTAGLVRLSEVDDFEIAPDDTDPTGWTVYAGDYPIGHVTDLLVDRSSMKVRYVEVQTVEGVEGDANENRVNVPVEHVKLSSATLAVELIGLDQRGPGLLEMLRGLGSGAPRLEDSRPSSNTPVRTGEDETTARVTRSEEDLRIGTREVQAGEVVVQKTVETERVRQPVARRVERIHVERRPAGSTRVGEPVLEGDEVRVPIMAEEVVVEKRPVVKEEIVISKDAVTETEEVEADVRKERVEIDTRGDAVTGTELPPAAAKRRGSGGDGGSRG